MSNTSTLEKIKPLHLFIAQFMVWAIFGMLGTTVWALDFYKYIGLQNVFIKIFCFTGILFNLFVYKTYNKHKLILHTVISILVLIVCCVIGKFQLSYLWFFLLSISGVSFKNMTKVSLAVTSIMVTVLMILTALGIAENVAILRPEYYMVRYGYGFLGPNAISAYIFQICIAAVYLRWKDFGIKDNLFLFCCCWLCIFFTNCKTAAILIFLLIFLVNFSKFIYKKGIAKIYAGIAYALIFIIPLFSYIITKLYCNSVPFAFMLDDIFTCRFRNLCYCFASFPIHFFGTKVLVVHDLLVIHNLDAYILLHYGIIVFTVFLLGYITLIKKCRLYNNIPLLIILILSLTQGGAERIFLFPYMNYTILAFSALLNNSELIDKDMNNI